MEKNSAIAQQMESFLKLFHATDKLISFSKQHWLGEKGTLTGLVNNTEHRLILQPSEIVKTIDTYQRRVLVIGTAFGPIAIYPSVIQASRVGVPTLSYCTTDALATAVSLLAKREFHSTGRLADQDGFPFLALDELAAFMLEVVTYHRERFMYVGDGLKVFSKKKFKGPQGNRRPEQKKAEDSKSAKQPNQAQQRAAKKPHKHKDSLPKHGPKRGEASPPGRKEQTVHDIAHAAIVNAVQEGQTSAATPLPEEYHPALAA